MKLPGSDVGFAFTSRITLPEQVWTGLQWSLPYVTSREGSPDRKSRGGTPPWPVGGGGVLYHVTHPVMHLMLPTPWHTDTHLWKHDLSATNKKGKIKATDIVLYLVGYPLQLMSTVSTTPHASNCWCTYTASNLPADDCVFGLIQRM